MATSLIIAAFTVVTALVGSWVTWKISKRNTSGAIDTSVAADLWAEGGKIRGELRTDLAETKKKLDDTTDALREAATAITDLNTEIRESREETAAALEESRLSRQETRELKEQIKALTSQITELHKAQLEAMKAQTESIAEKTDAVKKEVKTKNGNTLGELADHAETRRVLQIPEGERTDAERAHLDVIPDLLDEDLADRRPDTPNKD